VHATLVDSMPRIYDLFVAPLSRSDREDFYRDSRRMAALLGIAAQVTPATSTDFAYYMDAMLESDALTVGADARQLVEALFAPRVLGPLGRWASFVGIGLLPARWREEYGFTWDEKRERRLQKLAILSRRIRPFLPDMLCVQPRARAVEKQQGVVKNL
jgi:uncharacterized protein (DUF2236 family)